MPVAAMKAMSSRRAAVVDLAEEVGAFTARGRQVVALMTRPPRRSGLMKSNSPVGGAPPSRTTV